MRATYINFFDVKINQLFYYREFGLCVKSGHNTFFNCGIEYTVESRKVLCIVYVV